LFFLLIFAFWVLLAEKGNALLDKFPHNSPADLGELWGNLSKNKNAENGQLAVFGILCGGAWLKGGPCLCFHDMYWSGGRMR